MGTATANRMRSKRSSPDILRTWLIAVLFVIAAACSAESPPLNEATPEGSTTNPADAGGAPTGDNTDSEPVKLGLLNSYTGVFAAVGNDIVEPTVRLYLENQGGTLGGRPVELVVEDDESDPEAHVRGVERLVEDEGIDVLVGLNHSGGSLAVRDYLHENQVPTLVTLAGASELTQSDKSPYIFRTSFANGQQEPAGAVLAREAMEYDTMLGIGADYAAGHQLLEPLLDGFRELGGTVVDTLWHPLGTDDFSTYISQIQGNADQVDAVTPMMFGADATRFFGSYNEFGVELPVYAFGDVFEQTLALDSIGSDALGVTTYWYYSPLLDNEENNEFRELYVDAYDRLPGGFSATAWAAMQFLDAALAETDGSADPDALVAALEGTEIESPLGPMRFDEDHGVIFNVYLAEIVETEDGYITQKPLGPAVLDVGQYTSVEEAASNYEESHL